MMPDAPLERPRADPVPTIIDLLGGARAERPFGEPVAMGVHLRQCAALAQGERAPDALVVAALLHDVGYLLAADAEPDVDARHAEIGARWIAGCLGQPVSEPVRLHTEAKRYLVTVEPSYRAGLSAESQRTLARQGGTMSSEEVRAFEAEPYASAAVALRRWDDRAKDKALDPPPAEHYRALIASLVASTSEISDHGS